MGSSDKKLVLLNKERLSAHSTANTPVTVTLIGVNEDRHLQIARFTLNAYGGRRITLEDLEPMRDGVDTVSVLWSGYIWSCRLDEPLHKQCTVIVCTDAGKIVTAITDKHRFRSGGFTIPKAGNSAASEV